MLQNLPTVMCHEAGGSEFLQLGYRAEVQKLEGDMYTDVFTKITCFELLHYCSSGSIMKRSRFSLHFNGEHDLFNVTSVRPFQVFSVSSFLPTN